MSNPLFVILGLAVGVSLYLLASIILNRRESTRPRWIEPPPRPRDIPMFCPDCGKAMISLRSQRGFNTRTGDPLYSYERACPDATSNPALLTAGAWPNCGQRVAPAPVATAHNHLDPTETSLACPVCIDTMFANGVLSPSEILKLYDKAGVRGKAPALDTPVPGSLAALFDPALPPARARRPDPTVPSRR